MGCTSAVVDISVALVVGVMVVAALPIIRLVRLAATVAYNPSSGAVGVAVDAAVIFLADDNCLWNAVVRSLLRNSNVL